MDLDIPSFREIEEQYDAVRLAKNKAITPNPIEPIYAAIIALQSNDTPPLLLF